MKNLTILLAALVLGTSGTLASGTKEKAVTSSVTTYGNPFIFIEQGVTFSVYPDGEFDFYINDRPEIGANVQIGAANITFNSGYNYDAYVQYDDYGAVIQIENVPVYYDYYGRVNQIGGVNIWYRNGRVHRIGGMYVYYNGGVFSHYSGYVNGYNRHYIYRPYHRFFIRPAVGFCLVYNRPYRRYYSPVRYSYYRPYTYNKRRAYARIGQEYRYNKAHDRARIYRNDKRAVAREHGRRSEHGLNYNRQATADRSSHTRANTNATRRSNTDGNKGRVEQRAAVRYNRPERKAVTRETRSVQQKGQRTVTQRSVTRSPRSTTVKRSSTTTYRKPVSTASNRRVATSNAPSKSQRSTTARSNSRSNYSKSDNSGRAGKSGSNTSSRPARSKQVARSNSKDKRIH